MLVFVPSVLGSEEAAGFDFFLTSTPFSDFLRSFFPVAGDIVLILVAIGCGGALVTVPTAGLVAAVSRAATALREFSIVTAAMTANTLSEALELFPIHLLADAFFFALFLKHGVEEEHFVFFQSAELVTCMQMLVPVTSGNANATDLICYAPPILLAWLPEAHETQFTDAALRCLLG